MGTQISNRNDRPSSKDSSQPNSSSKSSKRNESRSKSRSRPRSEDGEDSNNNLWLIGFTLAILTILFSQEISDYFNSNDESFILKQRSSLRNPNITAWKVLQMDSRGGGYGVIAQRDIFPGELIMKESPLIKLNIDHSSMREAERTLEGLVKNLSGEDRIRLLSLSNAFETSDDRSGEEEKSFDGIRPGKLSGILQTNGMNSGRGFFSIFPTIARLNHGCLGSVNAVYNWRELEKVQVVHVTKHIKKGQEILISYFDSKLPRLERRSYLENNYKFRCNCESCARDEGSSRESDLRIIKINSLKSSLNAWSNGSIGGSEAIRLIEEAIELMNQEGMTYEFGQLYADASHIATAHSDFKNARKYASLALKHFEIELGNDSLEFNFAMKIIRNPTQSNVWSSRSVEVVSQN